MKVVELDPKDVKFNPQIAARAGEPDKETVSEIAASYVERREAGQPHQIQPGVVRSVKDGGYEVIVGRNRLTACLEANAVLGKGEEPFLFQATVVRDGDKNALVTAIQENEKRKESTLFDRADGMQRLLDLGMTQDEIARVYGLDKSTVSTTLAAGRLPAKIRKMVLNGDLLPDAALLVATPDLDKQTRDEIIDHALAERNYFDELENTLADRAKRAAEGANGNGKEHAKEAAAAPAEAAGAAATKKAPAKKPSKITKEAVARAAAAHPAAKQSRAAQVNKTLSRKEYLVTLDAMYEDKANPLPKSARAIVNRVIAFYDGDISAAQLRNALVKNCIPD